MNTRASLVGLVGVASVSALLMVGCGCDPGTNSLRPPIDFTPSSSQAVRTPATCGVANAPFTAEDKYYLQLLGETDVAAPYTLITVNFTSNVALNDASPLIVSDGPSTNVTDASSQDGTIQFELRTGTNASELDATPLASVVVTVTEFPTADDQPLAAELRLTYEDGRVLDQVYSAKLESVVAPCNK